MVKAYLRPLLFAALAFVAVTGLAEDTRTLTWEELAIKLSVRDNPFATLTPEQLGALSEVAAVRDRKARGITSSQEEVAMEKSALARLQRDAIDATDLLARRDEIARRKRAAMNAVNPALDGKSVRIPGYVLPLEYSGKKVTEFLLVPWVGACIHTPPPEANQIVYVKPDQAFDIDGMFQAVWVTGRIRTTSSTRSVNIVDGSSDVAVGYALRADKVERY
jgi:uncharacterized protein